MRPPKPLLLALGQRVSLLVGALSVISLLLAAFDVGTFAIGGKVVAAPEFLSREGLFRGVTGGLLLAIGVGLWRERSWVRPMIILYCLLLDPVVFTDLKNGWSDNTGALASAVFETAIAAWYLYGRVNVREYFARCELNS